MFKTTLCLFLAMTGLNAMAQKTNFSGTWNIQTEKVDWGRAPQTVLPSVYNIVQGPDKFTVTRTLVDDSQVEHPSADTLTYDNKPRTNLSYTGNKKTTSIKWSDDKTALLLTTSTTSPTGEPYYSATETWTLTDGGKTLVIDRSVEQANGNNYKIKGIYQKQ